MQTLDITATNKTPTNQTPDAETNVGFLGANFKHHTIMKTFKTLETINTIDFQGIGGDYKVIGNTEIDGKDAIVIQDNDGIGTNVFVVYSFTMENGNNILILE